MASKCESELDTCIRAAYTNPEHLEEFPEQRIWSITDQYSICADKFSHCMGFPTLKPDTHAVISCYSDAVSCNLECGSEASAHFFGATPLDFSENAALDSSCPTRCAKLAYATCAQRVYESSTSTTSATATTQQTVDVVNSNVAGNPSRRQEEFDFGACLQSCLIAAPGATYDMCANSCSAVLL